MRIIFLAVGLILALSATLVALGLFVLAGQLTYETANCDPYAWFTVCGEEGFWYFVSGVIVVSGFVVLALASILWMAFARYLRQ